VRRTPLKIINEAVGSKISVAIKYMQKRFKEELGKREKKGSKHPYDNAWVTPRREELGDEMSKAGIKASMLVKAGRSLVKKGLAKEDRAAGFRGAPKFRPVDPDAEKRLLRGDKDAKDANARLKRAGLPVIPKGRRATIDLIITLLDKAGL
jgi:hypothetical protein